MRLRQIALVVSALIATAGIGFMAVASISDVASRRSNSDRIAAIALGIAAATLVLAALLKRWWTWLLPAAAWMAIVVIAVPHARQHGLSSVCGTAGGCYESPYTLTSGWVVLSICLSLIAAATCVVVALNVRRAEPVAHKDTDEWVGLPPTLA